MSGRLHSFGCRIVLAAALAGSLVAGNAQAACWTPQAVEAAQVRELETMLMVASLRCRLSGSNFIGDYNGFVRASRPTLSAANDKLREHFDGAGGLNAYDRYVTGIANRYGGGVGGMNCKDFQAVLDDARDAKGSMPRLVRLASAVEIKPTLPGGRCTTTVAAAR